MNWIDRMDDSPGVAAWFNKLIEAFGGEETSGTNVRRVLERAQEERARIELIDAVASPNQPIRLFTTIEQLRDDDVVISRPTHGGRLRPLATGGDLHMLLGVDGQRLAGHVRCLGRIRVKSGSGGMFYGYRMSLPDAFRPEERRAAPRYETTEEQAPDAELTVLGLPNRVHGLVIDLSASGMRMRSPNARGRIAVGQRAYLTVELPDPVGRLKETINIVRVDQLEDGVVELGISFLRTIPEVSEMLRRCSQRPYGVAS